MAYAGYQGYGTPASIDRQREIANALLGQAIGRTPRNIGEDLSAIGAALGYRGMTKRADKAEREASRSGERVCHGQSGWLLPAVSGSFAR